MCYQVGDSSPHDKHCSRDCEAGRDPGKDGQASLWWPKCTYEGSREDCVTGVGVGVDQELGLRPHHIMGVVP